MTRLARIQPRQQIIPFDLVAPGSKGLNTVLAGQIMPPVYCAVASNAVVDIAGRLAARNGFVTQTTTPLTAVTVTNESEGNTSSGILLYSGLTLQQNLVPSTVSFTVATVGTATDNGLGQLSGAGFTGGTINYTTGAWTLTLTSNPGPSHAITATYNYVPAIRTIYELNSGNSTYTKIVTWNGGGSTNVQNPNTNSIAGTASLANGRWWFQNFNGKAIGFQVGQQPAVLTTPGDILNTIVTSSGTWSNSSGVGAACFGRVWNVQQGDGQTIEYSDLLDETARGTAGSGQINMATIWSDGTDQVTAIFAFNAALVVCGTKHIVMFTDGRGSQIGLDPTQAYVFDIILGTGCTSQWTVDHIGQTDVVFLAPQGVQSLQRVTASADNPTGTLTKYVRDALLAQITAELLPNITGIYDQFTGYYLLALPVSGTVYCCDVRRAYNDDVQNLCAIVTTWTASLTSLAEVHLSNSVPFTSIFAARTAGTVALYSGNSDEGTTIVFTYLSPWLNFVQEGGEGVSVRLKMLKSFTVLLYTGGGGAVSLSYNTDFGSAPQQANINVASLGGLSQYGIAQYGIGQYGGGSSTAFLNYDARARGQYYQIGVSEAVSTIFALQQIQLNMKIGRINRGLLQAAT